MELINFMPVLFIHFYVKYFHLVAFKFWWLYWSLHGEQWQAFLLGQSRQCDFSKTCKHNYKAPECHKHTSSSPGWWKL